jgi:hypothetical protein
VRLKLANTAVGIAAAVTTAGISVAPIVGADPVWPIAGAESAEATINDLEAQGYNVQINWVMGLSDSSLSRCSVTAIHNPDRSPDSEKSSITVYVDVSCPQDDRRGAGGFGIGVGF